MKKRFWAGLAAGFAMLAMAKIAISTTILYSDLSLPYDWPLIDDSKLASITFDSVQYGQKSSIAHTIDSLDNPTPVKLSKEITYTYTTGWTKTYSETNSATVNSQLEGNFNGIGTTLGSALNTTVNVGAGRSSSTTVQKKLNYCATCEGFDVLSRDIFDQYLGTFSWYQDIEPELFSPGFNLMVSTWGLKVITGTTTEIANYHKYTKEPCPVPEPATILLFGTGIVGLAGVARRKKK